MDTLGQVTVRVKTLQPKDSIGKAAELIRCSNVGAVPVIEDGRLLGMLTADSLADFLSVFPPERARDLSVASLTLEGAIALPEGLSPAEALQFLQANGLERAVVLDDTGGLVGVITRAELLSPVCGRVRPPLVGGMATPFGVYLTGGGVRGGVGDFALMTTGMYLTVLNLAAVVIADLLLSPGGWIHHLPAPAAWVKYVSGPGEYGFSMVVFALMFKLSWFITGYHAAEHQVVHAIEAGDDLYPEVVRSKPRVHPRCGTNLVAAVLIMTLFWTMRTDLPVGDAMVAVAMLTTLFLWRRVGGWLQQNVTTGPASPRQIQSGITAAQELMERYQKRPAVRMTQLQRIWNMGLVQVMSGSLLVLGLVYLLDWLQVPLPPGLR